MSNSIGKGFSSRNNEALKVVWLCHFSNSEIQKHIKPHKEVGEYAPWINNLLPLFENNPEIELHVIVRHKWLSRTRTFKLRGINYYFIPYGIPFIGRPWPSFFRLDLWSNYFLFKQKVKRIVNKINPHIIHLHGAENEFSSAITQFHNKYPIFITIQGFVHKSSSNSAVVKKRKGKELEILKKLQHFGIRTQTMGEDVRRINKSAVLHWHSYRQVWPSFIEGATKEYDIVFFARISKEKGIGDLIQVLPIIKQRIEHVKLCVIGGGKKEPWLEMATQLNVQDNIVWLGFLPTQDEVHKYVSKAKVSVLPTYHDIISGTIIESLFLKIPVVAYNVGSIHEVNRDGEVISLVEKGDIEGLASSIIELLQNDKLRHERAESGYRQAKKMFSKEDIQVKHEILTAYKEVIQNFNQG